MDGRPRVASAAHLTGRTPTTGWRIMAGCMPESCDGAVQFTPIRWRSGRSRPGAMLACLPARLIGWGAPGYSGVRWYAGHVFSGLRATGPAGTYGCAQEIALALYHLLAPHPSLPADMIRPEHVRGTGTGNPSRSVGRPVFTRAIYKTTGRRDVRTLVPGRFGLACLQHVPGVARELWSARAIDATATATRGRPACLHVTLPCRSAACVCVRSSLRSIHCLPRRTVRQGMQYVRVIG
jgi:hypothetical protein